MTIALKSEHFSRAELSCKHCGKCDIQQPFLDKLELLRVKWGKPLHLASAYRCPEHNAASKGAPSSYHIRGQAVDLAWSTLSGKEKADLLRLAINVFTGIGLHKQFLHIDNRDGGQIVWFY